VSDFIVCSFDEIALLGHAAGTQGRLNGVWRRKILGRPARHQARAAGGTDLTPTRPAAIAAPMRSRPPQGAAKLKRAARQTLRIGATRSEVACAVNVTRKLNLQTFSKEIPNFFQATL
jgi:hypothetical protein